MSTQQATPAPSYEGLFPVGSLPRELRDFRGYHAGETFLVCGCGSSLSEVVAPERFVTVGVNDVGRLFQPDYLVVLNPRHQFREDRFRYVEESRARAVFTQLNLGINHPHVVHFRLGTRSGVTFDDPSVLHYTRNSPYLALCLAIHMGAKRIGLSGVDFTEHHFFGETGRHPLTSEFPQIEREYARLAESCRKMGIEVVNLSRASRLTAFEKMTPAEFARRAPLTAPEHARARGRKVFFVNYKFLSCGEVFRDGLDHAAEDLGVTHEAAYWDDPALPDKVKQFSPDLLFVVHGRKFAQRWSKTFANYNSAVWLLDEPYEVDDTSRYSGLFKTVFVNDPATLHRHRNAHYLPVCYDPADHWYRPGVERKHAVGFVGGYNPLREQMLELLAARGLLSYVVGGPWRKHSVNSRCLSGNIPASETARLYRQTSIVINVFRTVHHFNREGIAADSVNPRVYEAAQSGALVVSQRRPELARLCPGLPAFETAEELVGVIKEALRNPLLYERLRRACVRQLAAHTYAQRLSTALDVTQSPGEPRRPRPITSFVMQTETALAPAPSPRLTAFTPEWDFYGDATTAEDDGTLTMRKATDRGPGTEQGLAGRLSYRNVVLSCEVFLEPGACLVAKIHQERATAQRSNSYHVLGGGPQAHFARHNHAFADFVLPTATWFELRMVYHEGIVLVEIDGEVVGRAHENLLAEGFCFLGLKGGTVRLRNVQVKPSSSEDVRARPPVIPAHRVLYGGERQERPAVSIITTVYDRAECLELCLRSAAALNFQDYEQIVVADCPPPEMVERLLKLTEEADRGRGKLTFASLDSRHNNWGIAPATVGLNLARARYVCFFSDDNGYTADHFDPLVAALERDPGLGFVYSSCLYAGRAVLRQAPPRGGRIDLGQPLFRRELFDLHLGGVLPFGEFAWDWRMIERFMRAGVRWRHIDRQSFIFRLAKYPHLIPPK